MIDDDLGSPNFLPGVPTDHIIARLNNAGGSEIERGKLRSPESSADLAVNSFGWFIERPADLPPLPALEALGWPAIYVEVEYCARFPWKGGRHPWLDAVVETKDALIGIESKRFEPFRDAKSAVFSEAYAKVDWGEAMAPFAAMRDLLSTEPSEFRFLDAAQLVKHAFGLVTDARRSPEPKRPFLAYVYAEPSVRAGRPIDREAHAGHRQEIERFARSVEGAEVSFVAFSYREWLSTLEASPNFAVQDHARAISGRFAP